ncbi:MAG: flagellar basal body P-ring protein FlgI [Phycisphaerae bacterium]|nr:flagellar basal body P-ring protein FlgI [Phycisphaerae bacterium]
MIRHATAVVGVALCAALVGCWPDPDDGLGLSPDASDDTPLHIRDTVAEQAVLRSGGRVAIQGYGLVVGLGENGSDQVPPNLRKHFVQELGKEKLGSYIEGTESVTPTRLLEDLDTAAVLVGGSMPPGAPVGTRFDVFVSAFPQSGTRSLAGGVLMPAELRMAVRGMADPGGPTHTWADADGSVFVNPFIDPTARKQAGKLLRGRIIGGGVVTRSPPVRLELRDPDYARSRMIERRINERFPASQRVAFARSRSIVEITIPEQHQQAYESFLRLVMHLPLRSGADQERRARRVVRAMQRPDVNHDELALVLQAMGRQVTSLLTPLYTNERPATAFYAARTGLRLGDLNGVDVLVEFARSGDSPYQVPAIRELGRRGRAVRALSVLRGLVDDERAPVRVAAYEALRRIGDSRTVTSHQVGEEFTLDVVRTTGRPVIYVTRTAEPRIVLFGRDIQVKSSVFFTSPDRTVTIADGQCRHRLTYKDVQAEDIPKRIAEHRWGQPERADEIVRANPDVDWASVKAHREILIPPKHRLMVWRRLPTGERLSSVFYQDFAVRSLLETLGQRAQMDVNRRVKGLNLTYGQVVGVLYRMCERGDIPAKFVLQPVPEDETMPSGM